MRYSIVNYQSMVDASHSMRLDAEFFHPDYLKIQHQLEEISSHRLRDFQVKIKHPKEIKRNYVDNGVLLLRGQNVRPLSIDLTSNPVYISEEDAERLKENTIRYKNILIMRSGANVGQCAIYLENNNALSMSDTLIIQSGNLNPFFLTIFLNTKYGKALIERGKYGSAQPHIAPPFLYQIPMPVWDDLPFAIEKTYLQSKDLTELSKARYIEAQTLLLAELGLADWQPKQRLTFVKNFSDTQHAERIDADYFQPKYDEIVNTIKRYSGGWDTLGNLCSTKRGSLIKDSFYDQKVGKPYIRGGDFSGGLLADDKLVFISPEFNQTNETQVYENDIVFSLIGSVGETALVTGEFAGAFISNNTGKIECNSPVFSVTLQVLLASTIGKLYFEKYKTQTAQPKISDKDLHNFVIPIFTEEKQIQIQQKVDESFNLRKRAKDLLEHAKRAVEIAIKQDEQAAISWLESVADTPLK